MCYLLRNFETMDLKVIQKSLMEENMSTKKFVSKKDLEANLANYKAFKLPWLPCSQSGVMSHECFHAKCIKNWLKKSPDCPLCFLCKGPVKA